MMERKNEKKTMRQAAGALTSKAMNHAYFLLKRGYLYEAGRPSRLEWQATWRAP
jgi:hypothetical protein